MRSSSLAGLLAASTFAAAQNLTSPKRGLVYVPTKYTSDDNYWDSSSSDLTWYYNYSPNPTSAFDGTKLQFVPMLFGAPTTSGGNGGGSGSGSSNSTGFYATVKALIEGGHNITYVLGFNEPDGCSNGGSCVDAQTAAEVWIQEIEPLKALGVKLGAPAVTGAPTGFNWLQNFFTQCAGGCTPDFIPVHWYGNFQGLASHLGQVNATYQNMTAWVTEFNLPDASLADTQAFYNQSTSYLDRLPFIERYSLFGAFRSDVSNVGPNAAMLTQKGQLTDIGAWYLGDAATGNIPSGDAARLAKSAGWMLVVTAAAMFGLL